jgi:uncharacterized membrane protein YfcA
MIPEYPLLFWVFAVITVILLGIAKAGFGGGAAILATPLLSVIIPVSEAAALLLPLLIICDFFSVLHYRSRFDLLSLKRLVPGAVAGITLGALFFGYFQGNQEILQKGIGLLALGFVLHQLAKTYLLKIFTSTKPAALQGVIWGIVSGFTSTLAHAGGPPVMMYLLPQKLPRDLFVGTTVIFFTTINLIKLIPYQYLGLLKVGNLTTILILSPLTYLGVILGLYLNKRFTDIWFNRSIYTILFLTGIQLITGKSLLKLLF